MDVRPYLFCLFFCLLYSFLLPFEDNGLLFWMPDVLCQHSEVVLWNLLSVQCSFDEFVGEKVVSPSYSSAILGPPPILYFLYVLGNCINCVYCFLNFLHSNFEVLEHLCYRYSEFFFR